MPIHKFIITRRITIVHAVINPWNGYNRGRDMKWNLEFQFGNDCQLLQQFWSSECNEVAIDLEAKILQINSQRKFNK